MNAITKEPSLLSLIVLSAFASMGAIIVTPGIPSMASFFGVKLGTAQLTMTAFLLGYALGQLIYGPIANRLGRKPAFYIGISVATLGSLFSILAAPVDSFSLLMLGRIFEALGSSVGLVVCFTIINDFYLPENIRKITGILMIAFAIVPGVAIAVGGFFVQHFGWQSCFYVLLAYGLALFGFAFYLPETLKQKDLNALRHTYLVKNYLKMFRIKKLVAFSLLAGLSGGCLYIFSAEGPYIGTQMLGFSASAYGLLALMPYIGTVIGSILLIKTTKIDPMKVITFAMILEIIGALTMFFSFIFQIVDLFTLFAPAGLIFAGNVMVYGTAATMGISQSEDKANASAVVNFLTLGMAMLSTFVFGILHISSPWIMPTLFLVALILMQMLYFGVLRQKVEK